jgi:hypothetical protein
LQLVRRCGEWAAVRGRNGWTTSTNATETADALIRSAIVARYDANNRGRARYAIAENTRL